MSAPASTLSPRAAALVREAAREGSQAKVARRIGYAPSSLSLALSGAYRGSLAHMEAAIAEAFGAAVACPWLGRSIDAETCRSHRTRPIPTANPADLKHWRACRYCPLNPDARAASPSTPTAERTLA